MMNGFDHGWGMGYGFPWIIGIIALVVIVLLVVRVVNQNNNPKSIK